MNRKILVATMYAAIAFCVVSYLSVMASLSVSIGKVHLKPITNIGFPYKYYYQFWLKGSPSPNCGWRFGSFLADFFIIWLITVCLYFLLTNKKTPKAS